MDRHAKEYFQGVEDGHFHAVIPLHDSPDISWEKVRGWVPKIPRGWYELSRLSASDRLEFTRDFWLSQLPYHPEFQEFIIRFFQQMDDIGIFLTQKVSGDPYEADMVYSLAADSGFLQGMPPATDDEILELQKLFTSNMMPSDFRAFLKVHNGFRKHQDTGILNTRTLPERYRTLQAFLLQNEPLVTSRGMSVDPVALIPFYESFGMPCYQCFWGEWYPQEEMGNVYYSGITKTLSDNTTDAWAENMAFPTFLDWLMFYLERVE